LQALPSLATWQRLGLPRDPLRRKASFNDGWGGSHGSRYLEAKAFSCHFEASTPRIISHSASESMATSIGRRRYSNDHAGARTKVKFLITKQTPPSARRTPRSLGR